MITEANVSASDRNASTCASAALARSQASTSDLSRSARTRRTLLGV